MYLKQCLLLTPRRQERQFKSTPVCYGYSLDGESHPRRPIEFSLPRHVVYLGTGDEQKFLNVTGYAEKLHSSFGATSETG